MSTSFGYSLQYWPMAAIIAVFGAWLTYALLAPTSWKEWRGVGLLQGFIIALYAEMYGFPLTIYFLTAYLGIDIPLVYDSGHLWATLLGYGRGGTTVEMLIGSGFIVAGALLVVKGWVRIHFAAGQDRFVQEGVYDIVRHPQYAGIYLIAFGHLVDWPTIPTLIAFPFIVWAYFDLARKEEDRMIDRFGDEYRTYRRRVPMFLPSLARLHQTEAS